MPRKFDARRCVVIRHAILECARVLGRVLFRDFSEERVFLIFLSDCVDAMRSLRASVFLLAKPIESE